MVSRQLCIVTHTFLPHVGGIERVVYEQSKRLIQLGFDVTVLTSRMRTAKAYFVDGVKVRCYDSLNAAFGLGIPYPIPQIYSFSTFFQCIKQSDLVHVHGHPYLSSLYASEIAKFLRKPVVLTQHNTFIKYEGGLWDHIEWLNDYSVGKQVIKNSDKIITVSNATKRYVMSLGADMHRLSVLHNGVDVDRFKPLNSLKDEKRRKLGIPTNATVVLTVRRLVYKNGIDTLIETATKVLKQDPELVFLVVGTGPDRNQIEERVRKIGISASFKLMGFVADEELPSLYNAADIFALPSKSGEGLPLVALEAMASGIPVLATDVGGIREIIPEACGMFVPPDSPSVMAKAILEFSRFDFEKIKQKIRSIAEDKYSWDKNVEKLAEIYEQLI